MPSSSASILNRISPFKSSPFIALAPSIPVSSFVVIKISSPGCFKLSSSSRAKANPIAIPSSPPRVVPLAYKRSPSTFQVIGSIEKSWSLSGAFSQTISM